MHTILPWRAQSLALTLVAIIGTVLLTTGIPAFAHAQATSAECQTPTIGQFQPYIYNGELHSFDYTITRPNTNTSYLPLIVTANDQEIPLSFVTVWEKEGQNVRVHVDVPLSNLSGLSGQVTITTGSMQITNGPPPICIFSKTFSTTLPSAQSPVSPVQMADTDDSRETSTENEDVATTPSENDEGGVSEDAVDSGQVAENDDATSTSKSFFSTLLDAFTGRGVASASCTTAPWWTWTILTILAFAVAITTVLYMSVIVRKNLWLTLSVLLPLLVFLGLWYVLDECRHFVWFPVIALLLSIGVLWASGTPDISERVRGRTYSWWKSTSMRVRSWNMQSLTKRTPKTLQLPGVDKRSNPINLPGSSSQSPPPTGRDNTKGKQS